ncbi:alkaline phosphatase PhoX [Parahaliea aestuarii]|uniref:DUF839 domain-containing protein n=1 Tax=Parahaliea aestuarii TaxID=1852021 RepID=A0A5C8ZWF8_9GAMM|nr:alkaline phosphatase PhoX [Parahaliea aestuarii]TXS91581.1 DUF839 domain-containing protein [Parahaliea aestuarii]
MTHRKTVMAAGLLAIASSAALAGTEPYFTPLTQSSAVATPNHVNELNTPWQAPAGISQENLTSMAEIESSIDQSVVRVEELGTNASMWDMVAFDPSGKFLFIPHETAMGAGLSRYSIEEDRTEVLFSGDATAVMGEEGNWEQDWGAFDPATFTPYGTVLLGEEWSGEGRVMEVLNPYADPQDIQVVEKESFANLSHEGIRFGTVQTNTVYFVDEDHSGSIYKFVASDDTFDAGDTYVLVVHDFGGDASQNWDADINLGESRTGSAYWKKIASNGVMEDGIEQDAFENAANFRAGRIAADQAGGTPFGRPEDVEVGVLGNRREVLYFAATSENTVYSVEMRGRDMAVVRVFASEDHTPKNVGFLPTTGKINSPDNLAQDALGNIYIIEDAPNGGDVGGDIWFVRDADNDGEAESVDHFLSIQVDGAEATGMIFNPAVPTQFVVSVQHPDSTDISAVDGGQGDALWLFDVSDVAPPSCEKGGNYNRHSFGRGGRYIRTCSNDDPNFAGELRKAAR